MTGPTILTAKFDPLPWQVAPFRCTDPVVLLTGSAGGGKSRLAAEKVHGYCLRYPGAVAICLRKRREFASKSVVYALKEVQGDDPQVSFRTGDNMFFYSNGSRIFIAGMGDDNQRQALRSINGDGSADIIWGEEANALIEDDHNELLARRRGKAAPWRQIIYSTNPDVPTHWIKRRLMDGGEAKTFYSNASDNMHNPGDYIDTLNSLSGVLHMRLAMGQWVQAEGVVFEDWNDGIHVIDPFPIPADWRRFRVIDFGYTNPFVCQWWAMDNDGRMYRYREIYMSRRTVKTHSRQIRELSAGENIETTITDHDAEDRATLDEEGIYSRNATKDVSRGIQAVMQRLKPGHDGRPRMFFFRDALVEIDDSLDQARKPLNTEQEFPGYVWQKDTSGRPVKEEPVKVDDHGVDATRYAVMYVDSGPMAVTGRENPFYQ